MAQNQVYTAPPASDGMATGLGESFSINLNTGQGVFSQKINLPDGVAGNTPKLVLEYASSKKHSSFGWGWSLNLRSIDQRLEKDVENPEVSYLEGGQELLLMADGSYRAKIEKAFSKYEKTDAGWLVRERNGTQLLFGSKAETRVAHPDHPSRIYSWLLEKKTDPCGNEINYTYLHDERQSYLKEIRYAAYKVTLEYEAREDARWIGFMGFRTRRALRCKSLKISIKEGGSFSLIKTWDFGYKQSSQSKVSLLNRIIVTGIGEQADGSDNISMPATTFNYIEDGLLHQSHEITHELGSSQPPDLTDPNVRLLPFENAPLPGILTVSNGQQWYWKNNGKGQWRGPIRVKESPLIDNFTSAGAFFLDADSSGLPDMMVAGVHPLHGYYSNSGNSNWDTFRPYPRSNKAMPDWGASIAFDDLDKDGRIDVLQNYKRSFAVWKNKGKQGWSSPTLARKKDTELQSFDLASATTMLTDMTGDGTKDLVKLGSGRIEYWQGLGEGEYGPAVVMQNSPRIQDLSSRTNEIFMLDVNQSGCADLVVFEQDNIQVYFNLNGQGFANPITLNGIFPVLAGSILPVDFFGTGVPGFLYNSLGGKYIFLELKGRLPSYLLTETANGFGLESEIRYKPAIDFYLQDFEAGDQWETHFPFAHICVESTLETDQNTGQRSEISMVYHEAHFEADKRQFQGFKRVERIEHGDESRPSRFTKHNFYCGAELVPGNTRAHAVLNGLLKRKEVFRMEAETPAEFPVSIEEADYDLIEIEAANEGESRYFVTVKESRQIQQEESADAKTVITQYQYDGFGNVVSELKTGGGVLDSNTIAAQTLDTSYTYAINEANWIIDRIAKKVVRDENGKLLSEVRNYYDGPDFIGLALQNLGKGLKTRQEVMVLDAQRFQEHYQGMDMNALGYHLDKDDNNEDAIFVNQERSSYDVRGLKMAAKDAMGVEESFTFDTDGLFKTAYVSPLGTTTYDYNRKRGKAKEITNVNGTKIRIEFDAMDRITAVFNPNNSSAVPSRTYEYRTDTSPTKRLTKHYLSEDLSDFTSIHTYFDGRLKDAQKRVEEESGSFIVSGHQLKNPYGDVKTEFEPFKATSANFSNPDITTLAKQEFEFDVEGRPVRTLNFFGGLSTAEYRAFSIITRSPIANEDTPENRASGRFGLRKIETIDPFNQRVKTVQETEGGNALVLEYGLNALGEMEELKDNHGIQAKYLFDKMGNRLLVEHREAGIRKACYNAIGQPVKGEDAKSNVITATYENTTNRLEKMFHNGTAMEEYKYDVVAQAAISKLAEVKYPGGSQKLFYDSAGRLERKEYRFEGTNRMESVKYAFDRIGRQTATTHTDNTKKQLQLYPNGWVQGIDGFADQITYDAFGNPVEIQFSNGVRTLRTYSAGGRKMTSQLTRKGNTILESLNYDYDVAGNLIRVTDNTTSPQKVSVLEYDSLEQLRSSETNGTLDFQYSFKDHLNLKDFGENQTQFGYQDASRPHRLTEILDGGNSFGLSYDANGNITALPGRQFEFNFKNELMRCTQDGGLVAEYFHDHQGKRTRKLVTDGPASSDTIFIADEAEYRNSSKAYFYNIGKVRLGVMINGVKSFVHNNYLGSSSFFTDTSGTKIRSIGYKPYGNLQGSGTDTSHTTFAAHPFDEESGLYYMQKRYYAPEIGRFVSADLVAVYLPKEIVGDPVSMHCYAYGGNNPVNNVDLEGTSFWSIVGGIVGAIVGIALVAFLGPIGALIVGIGLVAASYFLADANVGNDFGEFMRGFMIGLNAGMNFMFATALFGPLIGTAIGVINFLAVEETLTQNPVFEGILGWTSWLMPMSWLVTGIGLIFFVINLILAGVTGNQVPALAITSINVDWRRGMINMEGGAIRAAGAGAAFNMGNFSFYDPGSLGVTEHEIGHGLSLAAFGWAFHYIGAIDQAADPAFGGAGGVYAEDLAEGSMPTPRFGRPGLDMWA